jgi:two-component system, chemotaxis family, CheB/CheR fusion protein
MGDATVEQGDFERLLQLIAGVCAHDLSGHKPEPIELHVRRRMQVHRLSTLPEYLRLLDQTPDELLCLHREILNGVTSFFRDGDPFEALKASAFPSMLSSSRAGPIRIWVPACASGEEAYSIAICWLEYTAALGQSVAAEIIGTDMNTAALRVARRGSYPGRVSLAISRERLARYFIVEARGYRVAPRVRNLVHFRKQDITRPFKPREYDLVSCRNLLIYMLADAQRQILCNVHSGLRAGGWLLLGNSETVGDSPDLFSLVDGRHRLYQAKPTREERYA